MNILVIGNGFDLAHGLPTKYTEFLDWVRSINKIGEKLVWVDAIPPDAGKAKKWLSDESSQKIWEVKYDDIFISKYIDADWKARLLIEKTDRFNKWIVEHKIDPRDRSENTSIEDSVKKALAADRENKKVKTNNALDSVIVALEDLINNNELERTDNAVKFFLELRNELSQNNLPNKENEIQAVSDYKKNRRDRYVYARQFYLPKLIFYLSKQNFWILYFLNIIKENNDTWIDFEKEISTVIQECNYKMAKKDSDLLFPMYVEAFMSSASIKKSLKGKNYINRLEYDLNRLILLLEVYLSEYVEKCYKPTRLQDISELKVDHVLSFNYTHTFFNIYGKKKGITERDIDYVHGEINENHDMEKNNMVLGIDEYLPKERKDKDIDFIFFKKYYQRIYKNTGNKYKNWSDRIKKTAKWVKAGLRRKPFFQIPFTVFKSYFMHNIYFFGHSLDVTDKDILRDLILNDNVYTTIFYRNMDQRRELISNLVKVIGQDELIRKTGGSTKTIEFRWQNNE